MQYAAAGVNTRGQMVAGNQNWNTQLQGTDVDFPLIRSWQVAEGAFFTPIDVTTASKVVVIGTVVRDQLFGADVDPVGQVIRVQNQPFTVDRRPGARRASPASARIRTTWPSCRTRPS